MIRSRIHTSIILSSMVLAACGGATEASLGEVRDSEIGATDVASAVTDAAFDGRELRFRLARPAVEAVREAAALTLVQSYVTDAGELRERVVAQGAARDADGVTYAMTLDDALPPGARVRLAMATADGRTRELARLDVPFVAPSAEPRPESMTVRSLAGGVIMPQLPPGTMLEAAMTNTSSFFVASMHAWSSISGKRWNGHALERNGADWSDRITVTFGGSSRVDCARLPAMRRGEDPATDRYVLRVSAAHRDAPFGQLMYMRNDARTPTSAGYRGLVTCDRRANTLTFHLPGRPLGEADVNVHAYAISEDGYHARREFHVRATRPHIRVEMTKVRKDGDNGCEGLLAERGREGGGRACDVYIATGSVFRDARAKDEVQASRHPATHNWGNMREGDVRIIDAANTKVYEGPVEGGVDIGMVAFDADGGSRYADYWKIKSGISEGVCALIPYCSPGLPGFKEANDAIEAVLRARGDDDLVGKTSVELRAVRSVPAAFKYYGLFQGTEAITFERHKGRGVTAWLAVHESDPSFRPR